MLYCKKQIGQPMPLAHILATMNVAKNSPNITANPSAKITIFLHFRFSMLVFSVAPASAETTSPVPLYIEKHIIAVIKQLLRPGLNADFATSQTNRIVIADNPRDAVGANSSFHLTSHRSAAEMAYSPTASVEE